MTTLDRRLVAVLTLVLLGLAASIVTAAEPPTEREGVISHMGPGYPDSYLAVPVTGPRLLYQVCAVRCVTLRQTDLGPDQRVHPDRIADLSADTFEYVCDAPASAGLCRGSWRVVALPRLPETDTLP